MISCFIIFLQRSLMGKGEMCLGFTERERFGNYPMTLILHKALGPILVKQLNYWRQMLDNSE